MSKTKFGSEILVYLYFFDKVEYRCTHLRQHNEQYLRYTTLSRLAVAKMYL